MTYAAYIFDLDGTLLDTLPDLVRLTNMVLEERGWSARTCDEILSFVGDGGRALIERAVPRHASSADVDDAFARWRELYPTYGHSMTKPYAGIGELLDRLKHEGAKLGVLSNKFDAAVQAVIADHFSGVFDLVCGESARIPRKPDPTGLEYMMQQFGVAADGVVYVGDSATDVEVAKRAGVACVAVTWGYQSADVLVAAGADRVVDEPRQIC